MNNNKHYVQEKKTYQQSNKRARTCTLASKSPLRESLIDKG